MTEAIAASSIAQRAFVYMEAGPLSSFGDDSPQARDAAREYPVALSKALRSADWSFASRLFNLPEITSETLDPNLPHGFRWAPEMLAIRQVFDRAMKWRTDERITRTDAAGPLTLRATILVTKETDLPADFQDYVALVMAAALSPFYASSANRAESLLARADDAQTKAKRADRGQASQARWDGRDDLDHGGSWDQMVRCGVWGG
ncbi:MAG: hypothetical protein ACJA1L_000016 [Paracoccaceae bacterium]|jgi:hypothetical protein